MVVHSSELRTQECQLFRGIAMAQAADGHLERAVPFVIYNLHLLDRLDYKSEQR